MKTKFTRQSRYPGHAHLNGGNGNTATEVVSRIVFVSLLALGMGFAGPATAQNPGHKAGSLHASDVRGASAYASKVRAPGVPEPTYMAIQTKSWREND
jgi:hypothetical protein